MVIGPDGGSVRALATTGTPVVLIVPPGALASDTTITLTPLLRIDNLPDGVNLLSGVQLSPDGLALLRPATVEIPALGEASSGNLFAFTWENDGMHPCRTPVTLSTDDTNLARISVFHFSGAGLAMSNDPAAVEGWNGIGSDEYVAQLAALYSHAQLAGVLPWYDATYQALFSQLAVNWYGGVVSDVLAVAAQAPLGASALSAGQDAAHEILKWRGAISQWESEYFMNRLAAPDSWRGPLGYPDWDSRYESLGLSPNVAWSIDNAVIAFNQIVARGIREGDCRNATDDCARREFVAPASLWAELASLIKGFGTFHGAAVVVPRLEDYCDGFVLRSVTAIMVVDPVVGGSPTAIELRVGETHQLVPAAHNFLLIDLSHLTVWKSSNASVAAITESGVVIGRSIGDAVVTLSDADGCISDAVQVRVVDPSRTVTLSGAITLEGEWVNGCNDNCKTTCPIGVDAFFTYSGSYEIEMTIQSASGNALAAARGQHTISACCLDGASSCAPEGPYTWTASASASGFHDGNETEIWFERTDYPWTVLGLTLQGTYLEIPGTPRGQFSGTASILPFFCSCMLYGEFSLN
jgi:hypothetical protein